MTDGTIKVGAADSGVDLERLRSLTCAKWTYFDPDVLPAWVADMDLPPAPVVVDAIRALVDRGDFGYNMAASSQLAEAFSERQQRMHGWRPDPERVRVFCDVLQAVDTALWLHTEPGDGVVVMTPSYPPFFSSVTSTGRRVVECPLEPGGWRLDPDRLASVVDEGTTAILLCSPHNPVGRVFDAEELGAVAEIAERNDLLVISDEIWADLTYPGAVHRPIAAMGEEVAKRTVTISAASKSFSLAGLRCAVAHVGGDSVFEKLCALPRHLLGAVGSLSAEATLAAWTKGGPWLDETRRHLAVQRDHLASRLAAELPAVGFTPPEATYLAWLDMRSLGLGDDPAKRLLDEARVALSSGADFGSSGVGFARLNFATSTAILDEMLDRVVAAVGR